MINKKALLGALGVLGSLILIVSAVALIRGTVLGGEKFSGGQDSPYPYTWIEKENGSIVLTLENGKSGYQWELAKLADQLMEVSTQVKGGKTQVTFTPINEGITSVSFDLVGPGERLATVFYQVDIFGNGGAPRIHFVDNRITVRQGNMTLDSGDPDHPITVGAGEGGTLAVRIGGVSEEDLFRDFVTDEETAQEGDSLFWEAESEDRMVAAIQDVTYDETGMAYLFGTRDEGETRILLSNGVTHLFLAVTSDGTSLVVTDTGHYEPEPETDTEPEPVPESDTEPDTEPLPEPESESETPAT